MKKETQTTSSDVITVLNKTNSLLEDVIRIVQEDRELAKDTYNFIKEKGDDDDYISEDGALEKELNNALQNILKSSDKLTKVLDTVSKLGIAKLRSDTLKEINRPVDANVIDLMDTDQKNQLLQQRKTINEEKFLDNN